MDVAEDTFGVFVFILCLVDYRIKENHERPSGREDLPSLLLGGLFGNGVEDNFNWLAHDLLHFGDDVGVPFNDMCSPKRFHQRFVVQRSYSNDWRESG